MAEAGNGDNQGRQRSYGGGGDRRGRNIRGQSRGRREFGDGERGRREDRYGGARGDNKRGGHGGGRGRGKPHGKGGHPGHGGQDNRVRHDRSNPYREGYREERMAQKEREPDLPSGLDINDLDPSVLQDLKVLSKDNAERVAQHMLMATDLLEDDPKLALEHARAAKNRAGRVGVVRETAGVVAYRAGEWKEALSELRAARRMSGGPGLLAVMADAERGLGRPQKALELGRSPEANELDEAGKIELAIVLAGARHDLGQHDSALATLQRMNPSLDSQGFEQVRLSYAYADALLATGQRGEAKTWFEHAAKIDTDGLTDAAERAAELD